MSERERSAGVSSSTGRPAAVEKLAELPAQSHGRPNAERRAAGKALREKCPRRTIAGWKPSEQRADPVELLIANSAGRVERLLPIRYGRMLQSPFAFYRGAAAVMAHDLSFTENSSMNVVACGDCHLVNFGGFATPERKLVFDINDFDEASVAPFEWDLRRLTASFVVAGRSNGFRAEDCREAAWQAAQSYRTHMARYAKTPVLDAYYEFIDLETLVENAPDAEMRQLHRKRLRKAAEESAHLKEFAKLAYHAGNPALIRDDPPLIYHDDELLPREVREQLVNEAFAGYIASLPPERRFLIERFVFADVAVKVVGVGSVGTYCGIALFMSGNGDPLFLQFKEARMSVLEPYCGRAPFAHHGERVVFGQRLMQAASDIFLGWTTGTVRGRHFYLRQLRDAKVKPVIEIMKPENLNNYARACGWALARAHKRSGDATMISGYLGNGEVFEDAVSEFAVAYADQNERDHGALLAAVRSGRVEARLEG